MCKWLCSQPHFIEWTEHLVVQSGISSQCLSLNAALHRQESAGKTRRQTRRTPSTPCVVCCVRPVCCAHLTEQTHIVPTTKSPGNLDWPLRQAYLKSPAEKTLTLCLCRAVYLRLRVISTRLRLLRVHSHPLLLALSHYPYLSFALLLTLARSALARTVALLPALADSLSTPTPLLYALSSRCASPPCSASLSLYPSHTTSHTATE